MRTPPISRQIGDLIDEGRTATTRHDSRSCMTLCGLERQTLYNSDNFASLKVSTRLLLLYKDSGGAGGMGQDGGGWSGVVWDRVGGFQRHRWIGWDLTV